MKDPAEVTKEVLDEVVMEDIKDGKEEVLDKVVIRRVHKNLFMEFQKYLGRFMLHFDI